MLLELADRDPICGLEGTSSADAGLPFEEYVGRLASLVSRDRWSSGEREGYAEGLLLLLLDEV